MVVLIVEEAVEVVAAGGGGPVTVVGLEVSPFRVLALALVGVLVPAEGLRCRELAAAIVALEHTRALAAASFVDQGGGGVGGRRIGDGGVVFGGVDLFFCAVAMRDFDAE